MIITAHTVHDAMVRVLIFATMFALQFFIIDVGLWTLWEDLGWYKTFGRIKTWVYSIMFGIGLLAMSVVVFLLFFYKV